MTNREWVAFANFVKVSLIMSFPMTNSEWVTLFILWKPVSSDPFPITNSKWAILHTHFWKAGSSHLLLWHKASEWHCTFCERQSHHIFSHNQQFVSDISYFVKGIPITSFPMINRESVTLHTLWKAPHTHHNIFLWTTACQWHCTLYENQSHHICSYDPQQVSDISYFVKVSLIWSFSATNRLWVTLNILWSALQVSSHLSLWPTGSEWHAHFVKGNPITSFPMTNSKWVTLHILWNAVSLHLFLWTIASGWHFTLCEKQSDCICSYDQ